MDIEITMHVREIRKAMGLTILELSKKSGVSVAYISEIEVGKHHLTLPILCRLAIALDVDIKELFTYKAKK